MSAAPADRPESADPDATRYQAASPDNADPDRTRYTPPTLPDDPDRTRYEASASCESSPPRTLRRCGNYELLREIKAGGMGVVYEARDLTLGRHVALKRILPRAMLAPGTVERFSTEARAAAALHHPGIVPVYEVGEEDGQPFLVMQLANGGSLQQHLADGPLPPRLAADMIRQLAEAVQHAHDHGVVHRDLKPGNILLHCEEPVSAGEPSSGSTLREARLSGSLPTGLRVQLTDFGLARLATEEGLTATGEVMGTPSYMPPEQASGRIHEIGVAADIYSLGAVLYALLTGRPPFQAATPLETLALVKDQEPVPPRRLNPAVPRDVQTICLKCLEKVPGRRYVSAAALAEDLRRFLAGEPIAARPAGMLERAVKWVRRRPVIAGLLAAVVVLTLSGVSGIAWAYRQAIYERDRAVEAERLVRQANSHRVRAQVQQLGTADAGAVPGILKDLEPFRDEVLPRLRELWDQGDSQGRRQRMRVGLALLASEPETVLNALLDWMLATEDPRELELTRDVLAPHAAALKERLWARVDDQATTAPVRFRALVGLARFDPDNSRWGAAAPATLEAWLRADPLFFGVLTRALRPVRAHLIAPLLEVAQGRKEMLADRRYDAAAVLAVYAAQQPATLVDVLAEADERQFNLLFPQIRDLGNETLVLLQRELERRPHAVARLQPDAERDALARRQANVATALLRLKQEAIVWPLLRHTPDPTRRSYLALGLASRGVDAETLVVRLESEPEVSERRALLSALGEYDEKQLPAAPPRPSGAAFARVVSRPSRSGIARLDRLVVTTGDEWPAVTATGLGTSGGVAQRRRGSACPTRGGWPALVGQQPGHDAGAFP